MARSPDKQTPIDGPSTEEVDYERRAISLRSRWGWFLLLGLVMTLALGLVFMASGTRV